MLRESLTGGIQKPRGQATSLIKDLHFCGSCHFVVQSKLHQQYLVVAGSRQITTRQHPSDYYLSAAVLALLVLRAQIMQIFLNCSRKAS